MELTTEWITYSSGRHAALSVRPTAAESTPLPIVVVVQEAWGVDAYIQDIAARLATAGYAVMAPDLYWSDGERPEALTPDRTAAVKRLLDVAPGVWSDAAQRDAALQELPEDEREPVAETLTELAASLANLDVYTGTLRAAVAYALEQPFTRTQSLGSIGFCVGGALVGRLASIEPRMGCGVIFYGAPPPAEQRAGITCPLLGLYGGEDDRITSQVPEFAASLEALGKQFEYHVYPGAPHAFFNDTRASYRVDASRNAWAQTLGFLARHLVP